MTGVNLLQLSAPDLLSVVYWICVEHLDAKERKRFDRDLNTDPEPRRQRSQQDLISQIQALGGEVMT